MGAGPIGCCGCERRPSTQRNIVKPRDWQDYKYPFIYGQIDPALFPIADWRECSRQALSLAAVREWASDRFTDDDPQFIEQIRTLLLPRRGVFVAPEEILLTVGAQHAIYLLATLAGGRAHGGGHRGSGLCRCPQYLRAADQPAYRPGRWTSRG